MPSTSGAGSAPVLSNPSEFPKPLGYDPFPNTLAPYVAAVLFETFLYGVYTMLFSICIYILIRRRQILHWILPVLACVMFSIATADVSYTMYLLFQRLLKGALTFDDMRPKYWMYVTNNILADSTLLYRCYVVWGRDLKIIAFPALLFVSSIVCGYLFEGSSSILFAQSWVYVLLTFIFNVILTSLIAGRIWWLSWKGKKVLGADLRKRYYVALAAILESGLLMALYMLPDLILVNIVLDNGFVQVVGIVPTLIVVQVGLGRAVDPVQQASEATMEPLQIAELNTNTQDGDHALSCLSSNDTGMDRLRIDDCMSSGTLAEQSHLRSGEDRMIIEEDLEEKFLQRDVEPEDSEFGALGRDLEKMSESRRRASFGSAV